MRKTRLRALAFEPRDDLTKRGDREHLPTARDAFDAERTICRGVLLIQRVAGFADEADRFATSAGERGGILR